MAIPAPTVLTSGSGNFTTSATTTLIRVALQGPGGTGWTRTGGDTANGSGGGSGEYCEYLIPVAINTAYAYVVGTAGNATTLTVGSVVYSADFGKNALITQGGAGGGNLGPGGGTQGASGGVGLPSVAEGSVGDCGAFSGASGGGPTTAAGGTSGHGGACGTFLGGVSGAGSFGNGGGGAASRFGPGGNGGQGTSATAGGNGNSPVAGAYGAGGGGNGGGSVTSGNGAVGIGGVIIIIPLN